MRRTKTISHVGTTLSAAIVVSTLPAFAGQTDIDVGTNQPDFVATGVESTAGDNNQAAASGNPVVKWESNPYCNANPTECSPQECQNTGETHWATWEHADGTRGEGTICVGGAAPPAEGISHAEVLQAFRRVPLPESQIVIQPPDGRTLVNFDTIYSTDAAPFVTRVRLLGQRVELDITPSEFTWHFGDDQTSTSSWPGRAYTSSREVNEHNYILHRYQHAPATVHPRVDTTWSATWRVNGGPWQPVNGTVTKAGAPTTLEVVEAAPALVDSHTG